MQALLIEKKLEEKRAAKLKHQFDKLAKNAEEWTYKPKSKTQEVSRTNIMVEKPQKQTGKSGADSSKNKAIPTRKFIHTKQHFNAQLEAHNAKMAAYQNTFEELTKKTDLTDLSEF